MITPLLDKIKEIQDFGFFNLPPVVLNYRDFPDNNTFNSTQAKNQDDYDNYHKEVNKIITFYNYLIDNRNALSQFLREIQTTPSLLFAPENSRFISLLRDLYNQANQIQESLFAEISNQSFYFHYNTMVANFTPLRIKLKDFEQEIKIILDNIDSLYGSGRKGKKTYRKHQKLMFGGGEIETQTDDIYPEASDKIKESALKLDTFLDGFLEQMKEDFYDNGFLRIPFSSIPPLNEEDTTQEQRDAFDIKKEEDFESYHTVSEGIIDFYNYLNDNNHTIKTILQSFLRLLQEKPGSLLKNQYHEEVFLLEYLYRFASKIETHIEIEFASKNLYLYERGMVSIFKPLRESFVYFALELKKILHYKNDVKYKLV
jgi:hypothetical protein